jgi:di/tricarboxylate transporter
VELNNHAAFVLALISLALILFAIEKIRLQATAFIILVFLVVGFSIWPYELATGEILKPEQLLSVFGNPALIAVCSLMILGKGVETTHALQPMVGFISRNWSSSPRLTMLGILVGVAVMSAFLNNTPIVVVMLPILITIAQRNNTSPSKLLMPLGLATIIGGMATTIGTSTNILVVGLAESIAGLHIAMFDLAPLMLVAGTTGLGYLWLVAPALTPHRDNGAVETTAPRQYMATLVIDKTSPLAQDGTVAKLLERTHNQLTIDRIQHNEDTFRLPLPSTKLHAGDRIHVSGTREALKEAELELRTSMRTEDPDKFDDPEQEPQLMEILVTERSELDGSSFRRRNLVEEYGIVAIALHRPELVRERSKLPLSRVRLRARDILLCEGTKQQFERLLANTRLLALTESVELHFSKRASIALSIIVAVVIFAALDIVPIVVSALAGVGLMRATKCIAWRHIGQGLSTQVILVIVVSLALGYALMATEGDVYIAGLLAHLLQGYGPNVTIPALMLVMAIVTNVVSNNAAAVIGTPIGIQLAQQLGIPVEPMVLAVLFGANLSFATPIGYQTNLLVFSAGGYRFSDFLRVGLPLTLLMWVTLSITLIQFYID